MARRSSRQRRTPMPAGGGSTTTSAAAGSSGRGGSRLTWTVPSGSSNSPQEVAALVAQIDDHDVVGLPLVHAPCRAALAAAWNRGDTRRPRPLVA